MDTPTPTLATSLRPHGQFDLLPVKKPNAPDASIQYGSTIVLRTAEQARREELFMERSRTTRIVKTLRDQLARATHRRSKKTLVSVEVLDALLTRVENADA